MSGIFRRCSFAIFRADCLIRYTNNHHPMPQLGKIFRLMKMLLVLLRQYDKSASQGKQSMKRLIRQNRGVTNLEIEKTGIKDFDRCAKRYHIDYAIQKDLSCTPPRFLIFFKAQDADALNAAFKEYSAAVLNKAERPSVLAKLHDLAQVIANLPDKVRHKEEERGL